LERSRDQGASLQVIRYVHLSTKVALDWHFRWDADDRMTGVTTPDGQRWRYRYDALGRRIAKQRLTDDGRIAEQTEFAWDGPVLAEETRAGGDDSGCTTTWDWEPDSFRPLAQTERHHRPSDGAQQEWFDTRFDAIITDLIGTVTDLVSPEGTLDWTIRPTLWGITPASTTGATNCPLRFPRQYHDPETGLNYNFHRHYDPTTARYQSPDPLGLLPAPDPYSYPKNPLAWLDPLGLAPCPLDDYGRGIVHFINRQVRRPILLGEQEEVRAYHKEHPYTRMLDLPSGKYRWGINKKFVYRALQREAIVKIVTDPSQAVRTYKKEVEFIEYHGYKIVSDTSFWTVSR